MPPAANGQRGYGWRFIDLAELGINTPRSYVVTLLLVVLLPLVFLVLAFAAIIGLAAGHLLSGDAELLAVLAAAFAAVIVAGAALLWGVARTHRRPWMSLISADLQIDWRRLAIGAGVQAGLVLAALTLGKILAGRPLHIGLAAPGASLVLLLLMVPFQAASEEMLFRGYLTQALGRVLRSRVAIAGTVGLLFGAIHLNAYGPLTTPYLFGVSAIFSAVSLRDERLELAIGAHTALNCFGVAAGDALTAGGNQLGWAAFGVLAVDGAVFYGLTRLLVRLCCRR